MRPGYRPIAGLLCATLLLASAGCVNSRDAAEESRYSLYPGMTKEEVSNLLGPPAQVIEGDPGTESFWVYRFYGGPNAIATVALVVVFVALVALMAMSKSGGSFGGGGSGGDGPPSQIRLRFGGDGRLIDVSPPEPVPGQP